MLIAIIYIFFFMCFTYVRWHLFGTDSNTLSISIYYVGALSRLDYLSRRSCHSISFRRSKSYYLVQTNYLRFIKQKYLVYAEALSCSKANTDDRQANRACRRLLW